MCQRYCTCASVRRPMLERPLRRSPMVFPRATPPRPSMPHSWKTTSCSRLSSTPSRSTLSCAPASQGCTSTTMCGSRTRCPRSQQACGLPWPKSRFSSSQAEPRHHKELVLGTGLAVAVALAERLRIAAMIDAAVAAIMGLSESDLRHALTACDHPANHTDSRPPKGFWRVDKDKEPELRHTVLTLVAFHDLQAHIASAADQQAGIEAFLSQNAGAGWQLPETLRLADYGLGHDDRAQCSQPVVSRLGPRFYDWQLGQSAEEARRERGVACSKPAWRAGSYKADARCQDPTTHRRRATARASGRTKSGVQRRPIQGWPARHPSTLVPLHTRSAPSATERMDHASEAPPLGTSKATTANVSSLFVSSRCPRTYLKSVSDPPFDCLL